MRSDLRRRRRAAVRAYRATVRRCERELDTLPSVASSGASARPAIAERVLTLIHQVREIPALSGLEEDPPLCRRLRPLDLALEATALRARRVIEGGEGDAGVREPVRPRPPAGGAGAASQL